jgi:hypothetical protein
MSTNVSEVRAASIIALMMEAKRTSETSVDIQLRTRQYIPEDSELHTRHRENLKSHFYRYCCDRLKKSISTASNFWFLLKTPEF